MNYEHIKEKVVEVYRECKIRTFPIDCFSILKHYKMRTISYLDVKDNNPELYKAITYYSKDAFRFRMTIYYNPCNTEGRIRFSLMHELGHFILRHTGDSRENEDEADYFASQMLAPRVAIRKNKCETSDDLHEVFGLSYAAANRTLVDYKSWREGKWSKADNELDLLIYYPNTYGLLQHRSSRSVRKRNRAECDYIIQKSAFLHKHYDMFVIAENDYLYGDNL